MLDTKKIHIPLRRARNYFYNPQVYAWFLGLGLFAILIFHSPFLSSGDDAWFLQHTASVHSIAHWVTDRYNLWSGRIFSEASTYLFTQQPHVLWKLTTFFFYFVFCTVLYAYYGLFKPKGIPRKFDSVVILLIATSPLLINTNSLYSGALWTTGSFNYFWPSVLCASGLYPVVFFLRRGTFPHLGIVLLSLIALGLGVTTEQTGFASLLLLITLTASIKLQQHKTEKKVPFVLYLFLGVCLIMFLIEIAAPGNGLRYAAETSTYLPQLSHTPLIHRLDYQLRWFIETLVHHGGFILPLLYALSGVSLSFNSRRTPKALGVALVCCSILLFSHRSDVVTTISNFYSSWGIAVPGPQTYIAIAFWFFAIVLLPLSLFITGATIKSRPLTVSSLIIVLAYACLAAVSFSPTLYASGARTSFVPSLLLCCSYLTLLVSLAHEHPRLTPYITGIHVTLALLVFVYLFAQMSKVPFSGLL